MSVVKLKKDNVEEILSLTPMQQGMLYHYIQNPDSDLHFQQMSLTLSGDIKFQYIEDAFNVLIERNEALRTVFRWEKIDNPIQIIMKTHRIKMNKHDFSSFREEEKEEKLIKVRKMDKEEKFNLEQVPIRITWCKLSPSECELIISNHHILYDGWSNALLLKEFFGIHHSMIKGQQLEVVKNDNLKEYIKYIRNRNPEIEKAYWDKELANLSQITMLPYDQPKTDNRELSTGEYLLKLSSETSDSLQHLVKEQKVTLASVINTAWAVVLDQYNNHHDIMFGTTVSGRNNDIRNIEDKIGLFINTLPMRMKIDKNDTLKSLIKKVNNKMIERIPYEATPLTEIKKYAGLRPYEDLFQSIIVVENFPLDGVIGNKYSLKMESMKAFEKTIFDLSIIVTVHDDLEIKMKFNESVLHQSTIVNLTNQLSNTIKSMLDKPDSLIANLNFLHEKEEAVKLNDWNNTKTAYPRNIPLSELFEEQVSLHASRVAVELGDISLTYQELNNRANQLAHHLKKQGVENNTIVGLLMSRSVDMIVGLLGILKAGGVYLPLDPDNPLERISYMANDSSMQFLVTRDNDNISEDFNFKGKVILTDQPMLKDEPTSNLLLNRTADSLAYIIYTSGTTGKPKGTLISQYSVSRVVKDTNYITLACDDCILQLSNFAFDGSVFDIYGALLNGSKLVLIEKEQMQNMESLSSVIKEKNISVLFLTTALFNTMIDIDPTCFNGVRKVLFGGEKVSVKHVKKAFESVGPEVLIHVYGPTESTVYATYYSVDEVNENMDNVPIGKPLSNTTVYVVDNDLKILPIGAKGELLIGGEGLAKGYLNNEQLTNEKFIESPFNEGERLYRTGDLVKMLPDGNILYVGRIDNQIKLRGYRIEPDEIAQQIIQHKDIQEAIVIAKKDATEQISLCAYYVSHDKTEVLDLNEFLVERLPNYMIPHHYISLVNMPLTQNGKIDRKVLPEPNLIERGIGNFEAPRNQTEKNILKIIKEVLNVESLHVTSNFFDYGVHSLKAMTLVSRIHKELQVKISIRDLFNNPNARKLATFIKNNNEEHVQRIMKVSDSNQYLASSSQRRLFAIQELDETGVSYNIPIVFKVNGFLNLHRLHLAFTELMKRHEVLRSSFQMVNGELLFEIEGEYQVPFEVIHAKETEVDQILEGFVQKFDLLSPLKIRMKVIEVNSEHYYVAIDIHHIIADGMSLNILLKELIMLYEGHKLHKPSIQFKDYVAWENNWKDSPEYSKQSEYWKKIFADEVPVLQLPTDFSRPLVAKYGGKRNHFELDNSWLTKIESFAISNGTTVYTILLSVFNLLLHKYSGQEDIVVGSPIAGREPAGTESMIGMFVNTLPLRNRPSADLTVQQFINAVKENILDAFENQQYPLEEIIEQTVQHSDLGRNPMFDTMFSFIEQDILNISMDKLIFEPMQIESKVAKVDLTLFVQQNEDKLIFEFEYKDSLFKKETIQKMQEHFIMLLEQVLYVENQKISNLHIITQNELDHLNEINNTSTDYEKHKTLVELFEEQVKKNPKQTAIEWLDQKVNYEELNEKANQIARHLRSAGVERNAIVGLLCQRSVETFISILGILKSGGAYMPIDPEYPVERIEYMLQDSGAKWLLTNTTVAQPFNFNGTVYSIQDVLSTEDELQASIEIVNESDDLASVIYTSGSTGKPKGNLTTHYNISRVVRNTNYIEIKESDKLLQLSNYAFDGSTFDIYGALLNGATLVGITQEEAGSIKKLTQRIVESEVTVMFITTALFNVLVDMNVSELKNVRKILFGGEKVSVPHVKKALDMVGPGKLIHVYGPTESTVFATSYEVNEIPEQIKTIPIGKPIGNTKAYVMDNGMNIQPFGIIGELCLSGDGIAKGYLNNEALTKEKFINHQKLPGEQLYLTGDYVRMLEDGNIEYVGRIDQQVKIRGYRIELGEIAHQLEKYSSINKAIVTVVEDNSGKNSLCAYYTLVESSDVDVIKAFLKERLPHYLMPSFFIEVKEFPLTSNGKVDVKALPKPHAVASFSTNGKLLHPLNEKERLVAKCWKEVLGKEPLDIHQNFFELGGHSLKAMILASRLQDECNILITLKDIMKNPTIKEQVDYLETSDNLVSESKIEPVPLREEGYPVTSNQKRLFIEQNLQRNAIHYNMPVAFEIVGKLDKESLENACIKMIDRHESLRTSFHAKGKDVILKVRSTNEVNFQLEYVNIENQDLGEVSKQFVRHFDLSKDLLIRGMIGKVDEDKHILFTDMHHIISDGSSMQIFFNELFALYEGRNLNKLELQFKDYAVWKQQRLIEKNLSESESVLLREFSGELPVLELPLDYSRSNNTREHKGSRMRFSLEEETFIKLKRMSEQSGTTLFVTLLSIYKIFLSKYTGQKDIIVGSPFNVRAQKELKGNIGMFVETLPIRSYPDSEKSFYEYVQEVSNQVSKMIEHHEYPLEHLLEKLELHYSQGINPLFDTMFSIQTADMIQINNNNLVIKPIEIKTDITKFSMMISAVEYEEYLSLELEYNTALFTRKTAERMAGNIITLIRTIANNPHDLLGNFGFMTKEQISNIVSEINNVQTSYPKERSLVSIFEEQVLKNPSNIVIHQNNQKISYDELNRNANKLARFIKNNELIKDGAIIAILMDRSIEMITSMLAVLKAGCTYLPIDPNYPKDRIQYMLKDSGACLVLTQKSLTPDANVVKYLDVADIDISMLEDSNLNTHLDSMAIAYIMYTSGSTGNPKGIKNYHYNISRVVKNTNYLQIKESDIILQLANTAFDGSTFEIYAALLNGAQLSIIDQKDALNINKLSNFIVDNKITVLFLTTALFNTLIDVNSLCLKNTRKVLFGGEKESVQHVKRALNVLGPNKIIHVYGPTESTVFATYYPVNELDDSSLNVPIGKAISNTSTYVLDENLKLQPIGVPGQLCLSGDGLAEGYLNNPILTKEKFIENPFLKNSRLYLTGDLVKVLPDGNIEYINRMDQQVKIRGYRIEPGEISQHLMQHHAITEALIVPYQDGINNNQLCAYYVANKMISPSELKEFLQAKLPYYMVPSHFIELSKFEVTLNGKIDVKALPLPDGENNLYIPPKTSIEKKLAVLLGELFNQEKIGRNDDFFELGGHSLKAMVLIAKIQKEFNVEFTIQDIFAHSTLKKMANNIMRAKKSYQNPIVPVEKKLNYKVSSAQKRLYLISQANPDKVIYNIPTVFEIEEGQLDIDRLREAVDKLIQNHEVLRTSFTMEKGEILQQVHATVIPNFEYLVTEQENVNEIISNWVRPFDFEDQSLIRVCVVEISKLRKQILLMDIHHIIVDGISLNILLEDLMKIYRGEEVNPTHLKFKDFVYWHEEYRNSEAFKEKEIYWENKFKGEIPTLNLKEDYVRPKRPTFKGSRIYSKLDSEVTHQLEQISRSYKTTLFTTLLAIYNTFLFKYSGQEDNVVGTPVSGRQYSDTEVMTGMFVNTLPLRNHPTADKTFEVFLKEVTKTVFKDFENQDYLLENLIQKIDSSRDINRNPLFNTMLVLQNMEQSDFNLEGTKLKKIDIQHPVAKFDLSVGFVQQDDGLHSEWEFSSDIFKKETIERMSSHFNTLVEEIVKNPKLKLSQLNMVPNEEQKELIAWNNTKRSFSDNSTLIQEFETQVKRNPKEIAVQFEDSYLTYEQLNSRSNQLARFLREHGVRPNDLVAISSERSFEMIIALYGILKAGGAYLPIDPNLPINRINYLLSDSKANILLTQSKFIHVIKKTSFKEELVITDQLELDKYADDNLPIVNSSNDLAYVLYTSGSTGNPKGVMIEHKSVLNRLQWMQHKYPISSKDIILQKTPFFFDVSVWELFGWGLFGAKLHLLAPGAEKDPNEIIDCIEKFSITTMHFVPSMLKSFLITAEKRGLDKKGIGLTRVFSSGEALNPIEVKQFYNIFQYTQTKLVNLYGPTEATVEVTYYDCKPSDTVIPIGKPIDNTELYILNNNNQLQPIGVPGELHIAGVNLARGYYNKNELTSEKFIPNPFEAGKRIYKTGDLARWLPDGNIEFLGRIDDQIKLRGNRIELGEIERNLFSFIGIKEVVVSLVIDNENEYLCAYYTLNKKKASSVNNLELKGFLSKKLPSYMVPSYFVELEVLPKTPSGKIDRKSLPKPKRELLESSYVAPKSDTEILLSQLWCDVLGVEKVSADADFFSMGGHSLNAAMLAGHIQKKFGVLCKLDVIFEYPVLTTMADWIDSASTHKNEVIKKVENWELYPATPSQRRIFVLSEIYPDLLSYNMPLVIEITSDIDKKKIYQSCHRLIQNNSILRTTFEMKEGQLSQRIHSNFDLDFSMITSNGTNDAELIEWFIQPFDLKKGPLIRFRLIEKSKQHYLFMMDMSHIISDGYSIKRLLNEIIDMYEGKEVVMKELQFKDYAVWQYEHLSGGKWSSQEQYWKNKFLETPPVLTLPLDFKRPVVQQFEGNSVFVKLNSKLTKQINNYNASHQTTLLMTLLAVYNVLLSKYSNKDDIVVGIPVSSRSQVALHDMVGMFVNTLPLRQRISINNTFRSLLSQVKRDVLEAYENKDYPLESLINHLEVPRDMGRNPLFDTMFTIDNIDGQKDIHSSFEYKMKDFDFSHSKFDLTVGAKTENNEILLQWEYNTQLFKQETVERMADHFIHLLEQVLEDDSCSVQDLQLVTPKERVQLLEEFNQTTVDHPVHLTVTELIEMKAASQPEQIAIYADGQKLTYQELNDRANQLAYVLRREGALPNETVGIIMNPSVEMIVSVLGVLKSGAAYVPIDTNYPTERINYILKDSRCSIVVTQADLMDTIDFSGRIVNMDILSWEKEKTTNISLVNCSSDLAYVVYTSGSTGTPKGVMVEHASLVNLSHWHIREFDLKEVDRSTKYAGFGFDASVWEIFPTLLAGSTIYIIPEAIRKDIIQLNAYFEQHQITISFLPTQLCEQFMQLENHSLRLLLTGGDRLTVSPKGASKYELVNNYGPTENTVVATSYRVPRNLKDIPIGKPIDNVQVYVFNNHGQLQPIGVPGELYLGGKGVARGYWMSQELTDKQFVSNPYNANERLYKTGDFVKWTPEGDLEYIGRIDKQVNIRGYRIELNEITNQLLTHPDVKESLVIAQKDQQQFYLVGYVVLNIGRELSVDELRKWLRQSLPEYMIPAFFVQLETMPVTANGKIDEKSLMDRKDTFSNKQGYEAPRTENEKLLVQIWENVLGVMGIGISDNFFELGGDSIKAIQIASKLNEFDLKMQMDSLFGYPTIKELVETLTETKITAEQEPISGDVLLTPIQKWFFDQKFENPNHWNQSMMLFSENGFESNIVSKVFEKIVEHHDSLRMRFNFEQATIMDNNSTHFTLNEFSLTNESENIEEIATRIQGGLNIGEGPLVKLAIFHTQAGDHLLIAIHHLVVDGVSWRILLEDFASLYQQLMNDEPITLPKKTHSCKLWSNSLHDYANSRQISKEKVFWNKINEQKYATINTELDNPSNHWDDSAIISVSLSKEETRNLLNNINKTYHTEINDVLLTALGLTMKTQWGDNHYLIALEGHGREEINKSLDVNRTVGWFTSLYPVHLNMEHSNDISMQIKHTKEMLRKIPNKGIGYGLLRYLNNSSDIEEELLSPSVSFNYLGQFVNDTNQSIFTISKENMGKPMDSERSYLLDFTGIVTDEQFKMSITYSTKQFTNETISKLANKYKESLLSIINHCMTQEESALTPSDLGDSDLTLEELDDINKMLEFL